ncbi:hypothetical protein NDU88_006792 [Pleurodeles waltl]|uniref:Uncharacterized protein n=1 Tax=Pleurodeles waltl TaxID=8319 RepID=A0AAV7UM11_PLEWA|nr:hypothetical protein NDU88_006792 [Pleurodeles waltl]
MWEERRRSRPLSSEPKVDPEPYYYGYGYKDSVEGSLNPLEDQLESELDWVQDLGDASGLDTSPDTGMFSLRTVATEEECLILWW